MNRLMMLLAGLMLAGCTGLGDNTIHVGESAKPGADGSQAQFPVAIRIAGYSDGRADASSRKIGRSDVRVSGLTGTEVTLDRDVTDVVAASMRKQLGDKDLQVQDANDASARFELSGVVKEFKYDVKARDYVSIKLDSTLKEIATGKVVWAGEVAQASDRFAGVSGNNTDDIAKYLKQELGVVTGKTAEAINTALMAAYPALYKLAPGTKVIPGVTVFTTPGTTPQAPITPTATAPELTNSMLIVRTEPVHAKIYLDGVYYGMSPLHVEMPAGIYKVEAKQKGYRTSSEKVAVRLGNTTELELELVK